MDEERESQTERDEAQTDEERTDEERGASPDAGPSSSSSSPPTSVSGSAEEASFFASDAPPDQTPATPGPDTPDDTAAPPSRSETNPGHADNVDNADNADNAERPDGEAADSPRSAGAVLVWVRPAAVLALLATLLGRGLGPSLVGSFPGSDKYEWVPFATTVLSQATSILLALLVLASTRALLARTSLPLSLRFAASSLAGMVLGLSIPAAVLPLPGTLSRVLAIATTALTLVAATRGARVVPTRALSLVACMLAIGATFRQIAWAVAVYAGEHALVGAAVASRWIASAGMLVHAVATASALVWLATRRRRLFSPWTTVAMITAVIATRYAELGQRAASSFTYFIGRSTTELARPIHPIGPTSLRVFLVLLSALFALVAVCQRKQVPAILGAFALLLLGGVDADVPLATLFTAAGALVILLISEDKRTLWSAMEVDSASSAAR